MKTTTSTISNAYVCDGCPATASSDSQLPSEWKSFQIRKMPAASIDDLNKSVDLCPACSVSGNANGIAALAKLLD